jgi:hypothetical protein
VRVLVAIPWRPSPARQYAYELVRSFYAREFPSWPVITTDTSSEAFCLSGCRNLGAARAEGMGADAVILNDADTIPEPGALLEAIDYASTTGGLALPYDEYRSLREKGTRQYLLGRTLEEADHFVVPGATSGVYVASPVAWRDVGGQDERFLGWGFEDAAWRMAADTLAHVEVVPGRVYAAHHPSQMKEGPLYAAGGALVYRYSQAEGDRAAMLALLNEPGRFAVSGY